MCNNHIYSKIQDNNIYIYNNLFVYLNKFTKWEEFLK